MGKKEPKEFKFTQGTRDHLRALLADHNPKSVIKYINCVEGLIGAPFGFADIYRSKAQKKKELDRLRKAARKLQALVQCVDWASPLSITECKQKNLSLASDMYGVALKTMDVQSALGYVHSFNKALSDFRKLIEDSDKEILTISGDTPKASAEYDVFDHNLIMHYWATFKEYPKIRSDRGFMNLVVVAYDAAGFVISSSPDRMRTAIKKHKIAMAQN